MSDKMENVVSRINKMIGNPSTPPMRRTVLRMMGEQMIDPAVASSVKMGLELALDIIEEEFYSERSKPRTAD